MATPAELFNLVQSIQRQLTAVQSKLTEQERVLAEHKHQGFDRTKKLSGIGTLIGAGTSGTATQDSLLFGWVVNSGGAVGALTVTVAGSGVAAAYTPNVTNGASHFCVPIAKGETYSISVISGALAAAYLRPI